MVPNRYVVTKYTRYQVGKYLLKKHTCKILGMYQQNIQDTRQICTNKTYKIQDYSFLYSKMCRQTPGLLLTYDLLDAELLSFIILFVQKIYLFEVGQMIKFNKTDIILTTRCETFKTHNVRRRFVKLFFFIGVCVCFFYRN